MKALPETYKFFKVDTCDSTMDLCSEIMQDENFGKGKTCVVIANKQLKGRGRRGRSWTSEAGNLYASIGFDCEKQSGLGQLAFLSALAVGQSILTYGIEGGLAYKWPNDLLINNEKVGGVLIETQGPNVVIGIGLNITKSPFLVGYGATNLKKHGMTTNPDDFIEVFLKNFEVLKARWIKEGFEFIQKEWMKRAWKLEESVHVKNGQGETIKGIFKGIDSEGGLIIQHAEGEKILYSAQIIR